MHPPIHLVFTTCATREDAERLGRRLVEERVAACATLIPGAISFYTWNNEPRRDEEVMLLLKTTGPTLDALEQRIMELHSYECPEFVAVPAARVTEAYGRWVAKAVEPPVQPA
jgi:periplasmic divalent cation tolerance protein